jgi:glycosyltransferase involved in cell wall biosynthesis
VHFTGYKRDDELARHLSAADVFVFPSRTDTFGLVVIEALACGIPVAAFPVQGPIDIIQIGITGYLSEDLREAALNALDIDPLRCREEAMKYTWEACTRQFLAHVEAARAVPDAALQDVPATSARSAGAR